MYVRALTIATLVCGLLSFPALADKLRITTVPPGATVQINGVLVGTTPYEQSIPGGYLHNTKTALGARLGYPMVARLTLEGYAAKEIQMTEGPMSWVSTLKGHNHGSYWLLKTDHFQAELQSASKTLTGSVESVSGSSNAGSGAATGTFARGISRPHKTCRGVFKEPHEKWNSFFYH